LSTTGGSHRHRLLNSLVVVEMALALVLLVSAGLLIRSLARLQDVNPGFNPRNLMASDVDLPDQRYSNSKRAEFFRDLIPRINALPGVTSVAAIAPLPMSGSDLRISVQIEGRPVAKSDEPDSSTRFITPGYFRTMQVPLLAGRDFTDRDDADATPVIIVNDALARQFFPGENSIGKRIRLGISVDEKPAPMREIIGVVGNVKFENLSSEWMPETYLPYSQVPWNSMTIVARAARDPYSLTKPISETVRSLDKDLPTYNTKTVENYLGGTIALPRFNTFLLGLFAGLALLLTAVGLYGVISYAVAQRTREIGIRMALGAQPRDMMLHVVGQGLRFALIGVGLGLGAALSLTRLLSNLLFGVQPTDPVSFAGVVALLLGVAFLACYIPARRAMRVDPMVALHYE
jgi:putative ABC transport system permease protein